MISKRRYVSSKKLLFFRILNRANEITASVHEILGAPLAVEV
jgi:hypothetical protein